MLARARQQFEEVCALDMLNSADAVTSPDSFSEAERFAA